MYLFLWPKSEMLMTPNVSEDVERQELSFQWERKNGAGTLEDSVMVSYKTEHSLTI